jgi:hypothetical protein
VVAKEVFAMETFLRKFNTNAKIHIKVRLMSKIWIEPERERERQGASETERDRQTEIEPESDKTAA